jgi:20S proteasome alpha/beta subunit
MVTFPGFIEFEHATPKMLEASTRAIAMTAGDTLVGTRISREVAESITGTIPVVEIAQRLAAHYDATRRLRMEQQILAPRGLDMGSYYGGHATLNGQITLMIDQQMQQFVLGVELLLAGADDSGAHIYSVQHPGKPEYLHDVIGYAAIGSGTIHAVQSMIGFGHTSTAEYQETVFRVYASKRRSEVAPGVGHGTDMAILSAEGIHRLSDDELDQLNTIYEEYEATTGEVLTKQLEGFKLGEPKDEKGSEDDASE